MRKRGLSSKIYMGMVYFFLYLPIIVLIVYSFNKSRSRVVWGGFTFNNYINLFQNEAIIKSVLITLALALISAGISTVLGTMGAIGINSMKKRFQGPIMMLTYLPIISPEIVTGVSLMLLFTIMKIPSGFLTLVLAHVTFSTPYVILNVMPKLRQMDKYQYEAAQDLGCNNWQAFRKVVIPEISPGIISGFLMALTYSIDDFVISHFTSGSHIQTLPIAIYSMTRRRVPPTINALSAIIFLVVLIVLIISNIHSEKQYQKRISR